jgi:hypothetical protein
MDGSDGRRVSTVEDLRRIFWRRGDTRRLGEQEDVRVGQLGVST